MPSRAGFHSILGPVPNLGQLGRLSWASTLPQADEASSSSNPWRTRYAKRRRRAVFCGRCRYWVKRRAATSMILSPARPSTPLAASSTRSRGSPAPANASRSAPRASPRSSAALRARSKARRRSSRSPSSTKRLSAPSTSCGPKPLASSRSRSSCRERSFTARSFTPASSALRMPSSSIGGKVRLLHRLHRLLLHRRGAEPDGLLDP